VFTQTNVAGEAAKALLGLVCLGCIDLLAEEVGLAAHYSLCTGIRHSSDDKQATHQQLKQRHQQLKPQQCGFDHACIKTDTPKKPMGSTP